MSLLWSSFPGRIVSVWIAVALILAAGGYVAGAHTVLPGPSSHEALLRNPGERLAIESGIPPSDTILIVLSSRISPASKSSSPLIDAEWSSPIIEQLAARLQSIVKSDGTRLVTSVTTRGRSFLADGDALFTSPDKRHVVVRAKTSVPVSEAASALPLWKPVLDEMAQAFPTVDFNYISFGSADTEIFELIHRDLDTSLIFTLPLTFIVLVWAFGSVRSALIPLFVALVSLAASLGLASLISHPVGPISATANQLVVLLVLAIGVDYSLFMVARVREDRERGVPHEAAVARARSTAGLSVFWSGVTVALSLSGLFLMEDTVLTSMALVSVFAVLITVIGCVGALPSLLLLVPGATTPTTSAEPQRTRQHPLVLFSCRRPLVALLLGLVPLVALGALTSRITLGSVMERHLLPSSMQTARAFSLMQEHFPDLAGSEIALILKSSHLDELDDDGSLQPFFDAMLADDQAFGPLEIDRSPDRSVARYRFALRGNANDRHNHGFLHQLREHSIPTHLTPLGVTAHASGNIAYVVDETERYLARTPEVLLSVLICSMIFLLIAFRSIVVPLKALVLNLISTSASFGVLVLVFQSALIPALNFGVVEGFVPALLFAVLFGLSMDYHVLLLSRIQEEVRRGASTPEAVITGICLSYRTISSAALIMACVFLTIACLELPVMKQLGIGLAVAVILDATVIRTVLLPASMVLLGSKNWYLPRALAWLPEIRI